MSLFCCPVCGGTLTREATRYVCGAGHSYDLARQGYVNLLRAAGHHQHGDDRAMVEARRAFLEKGYYTPLMEAVADALADVLAGIAAPAVLDAGCGEGWYTAHIAERLRDSFDLRLCGVDVSKQAAVCAARRCHEAEIAVASVFDLPSADGSLDAVINLFAPFAEAEYARVLRPGGSVIKAGPLPYHLWELKELVYDVPYENEPEKLDYAGFAPQMIREVTVTLDLSDGDDVRNLFTMTPYAYRTPEEGKKRLSEAGPMTVTASFGVYRFRRI